jgi:hypothetical protein
MADMFGVQSDEFIDVFDTANLINRFPGKQGKGDAFPAKEAAICAARFDLSGRPLVVLMGKNVARAFGEHRRGYLELFDLRSIPAVVAPHPSGINRWWNDAANCEQASAWFKHHAPLGIPCTTSATPEL